RPSVMPGRSCIAPLRSLGFFDVVESARKLKFIRRGKAHVATLTDEDIGARPAGDARPPLTTTRKIQDVELPRRVLMRFINPARDYEIDEAPSPTRQITGAVNEVKLDVAAAIDSTLAARCAEVVWAD